MYLQILKVKYMIQQLDFIRDLKSGKSSPLKNITSGYHYHTVEADSEETLGMIGEMLEEKGFLVEEKKERA